MRQLRFRTLIAALCLLLGTQASGSTLTPPNGPHPDQTPQRDSLLNGLRIVTIQRPGERVAVVCAIRAGAMFDPMGKSGLANVTAGLLLYGAGSYSGDRIQAELEAAQSTLNITTHWDGIWIEAEGPAAQLNVLLDLVSLIVSDPRFNPEDLVKVKKIATDRIAAEESEPYTAADRAFARTLYGKHTYGRAIWGDADSMASITAGDVKVFFQRFYGANSAVLVVAGPAPQATVAQMAKMRFGRWQKKKIVPATFLPPEHADRTRVVVLNRLGLDGVVVRAGHLAPGRKQPAAAPVKVLAERLREQLRAALPAAKDVEVAYDLRTLDSPFEVRAAVTVADLAASLQTLSATMQSMRSAPDPPAMSSGRLYFPTRADASLVEARGVASRDFYSAQNLALDPMNYTVDEAAVAQAARNVLKPSSLTIVLVGNAAEITEALKDRFTVEVLPEK